MNIKHKIVTQLPLAELWGEERVTTASRVRDLATEDIASFLRAGRVQFVVVEIGSAPRWIPVAECYDFWKTEGQPHLAGPESKVSLSNFPNGYCYFASEWNGVDAPLPIVVFERHH